MDIEKKYIKRFPPDKSSICAVIVTYDPDKDMCKRITRVLAQVDRAIIVDNGSNEIFLKAMRDIEAHVIANAKNVGIGRALNQGVGSAIDYGYRWVLLLDDDSVPDSSMLEEMIAVYNDYFAKEKIGIIGANPIDSYTEKVAYEFNSNSWIEKEVVISSGSLIPIEVYKKVGPFKEEYFMDCIDQEYCLRLRSKGYRIIIACRAKMKHSLGQAVVHKFLSKTVIQTNHSYLRYYYIMRNSFLMLKEYFFKEPKWLSLHFVSLFKMIIKMLLFEDDKLKKIKSSIVGIWQGLFNYRISTEFRRIS